jgi:hypothetical protein
MGGEEAMTEYRQEHDTSWPGHGAYHRFEAYGENAPQREEDHTPENGNTAPLRRSATVGLVGARTAFSVGGATLAGSTYYPYKVDNKLDDRDWKEHSAENKGGPRRSEVHGYGQHGIRHEGDGEHGQQSLFNVFHQPPRIDSLFADPSMNTEAMNLVGIAAHESKKRYGEEPIPDSDLSEHSSRMVQHLVNLGITKTTKPPEGQEPNEIQKVSRLSQLNDHERRVTSPMSDKDVSEGRDYLRTKLKDARAAKAKSRVETNLSQQLENHVQQTMF